MSELVGDLTPSTPTWLGNQPVRCPPSVRVCSSFFDHNRVLSLVFPPLSLPNPSAPSLIASQKDNPPAPLLSSPLLSRTQPPVTWDPSSPTELTGSGVALRPRRVPRSHSHSHSALSLRTPRNHGSGMTASMHRRIDASTHRFSYFYTQRTHIYWNLLSRTLLYPPPQRIASTGCRSPARQSSSTRTSCHHRSPSQTP